ncbi:hypothetical protein F4810DRAFT_696172 [Camillea tinctor]|nr:hypothetical protein F4810DRAFT_696172 [Camillea tinctor]
MSVKVDAIKFLDYIRAFNNQDYPNQHEFYHDEVELCLPDPTVGTLKGKSAITKHYTMIHNDAEEAVIPIIVLSDRGKIFLLMETYFKFKREIEHSVLNHHVYPGDVLKLTSCAIYDINDEGKMRRITCYKVEDKILGDVSMKDAIKDSETRADPDLRLFNY